MKKQLLNLSMVAGALALYIGTVFAAPTPPYTTMEIPYALPAVVIDGDLDDVYGPEQPTVYMRETQQADYEGAQDFTCVFNVAWDLDYLYIYAEMQDDIIHNFTGQGNDYEFDNIEWFVQFDTNTVVTTYDDGTHQFRLNRGLDTARNSGNVPASTWGGIEMVPDNGTGWVCEIAMPWEAVWGGDPAGVLPEDIMVYIEDGMGFDFAGADSDGTDPAAGARSYQTAWDDDQPEGEPGSGDADFAWNNTSKFGFVTFEIPNSLPTATPNSVNAYPVPAITTITFEIEGVQKIEILSMTGNLIKVVETSGVVDVSDLKSGIYFARIGNSITKFSVR